MAGRSLNKVMLIGNVVRDPELRYTPKNTAVCSFTIATNRTWTGADGSDQESAEFTRVVAWGKLGEIANQILTKGAKAYVEGRLQTRDWETKEGEKRQTTEVIAEELLALGSRGSQNAESGESNFAYPEEGGKPAAKGPKKKAADDTLQVADAVGGVDDLADDIPF